MPMDGHHGSGLDGVQHPIGKIFRAAPEVQINPEARRRLRPGNQGIEAMLVNNHAYSPVKPV